MLRTAISPLRHKVAQNLFVPQKRSNGSAAARWFYNRTLFLNASTSRVAIHTQRPLYLERERIDYENNYLQPEKLI
jgi:hypothetical protein